MKLKTLYCRDENDGIREWTIEVDGNKFRTISGLKGGQEVVSEWTVCNGKNLGKANETKPDDQAIKEAKAKRKKKIESGYYEDINKIDESPFYEPMLCHKYDDHHHKLPENILVSPKMDGLRAIITKHGVFSRKGKPFPALDFIRQELDVLFKATPNLILDSEAYSHALKEDFDKIVSLVKKSKNFTSADIEEAKEKGLKAWIFDMPRGGSMDETVGFLDRYRFLQNLFNSHEFKYSLILKYFSTTKTDIAASEEHYIKEGFEGLIVRHPTTPYQNKRSYNLLKLKRFKDEEFKITDIEEGDGNRSGMMGRIVLETKAGKRFEANARGDREFYKELLTNKRKYLGKSATVRFQNYTPDQVPRFGVVVNIGREDYE